MERERERKIIKAKDVESITVIKLFYVFIYSSAIG